MKPLCAVALLTLCAIASATGKKKEKVEARGAVLGGAGLASGAALGSGAGLASGAALGSGAGLASGSAGQDLALALRSPQAVDSVLGLPALVSESEELALDWQVLV
ncbi:hypothetical protein MRX96_008829 [Rhipicephalus microplus]